MNHRLIQLSDVGSPRKDSAIDCCRDSKSERDAHEAVRRFLAFVWDGVDGYVELAADGPSRRLLTQQEALEDIDPLRDQYFSLLPRSTYGRKKEHVVSSARLLWVDIDRLEGVKKRSI